MNQVHVERGRALDKRQEKSLVERQHVQGREPDKDRPNQ